MSSPAAGFRAKESAPAALRISISRRSNSMCIINQNLFVVTGGPGSGKTTVLRELDRRGYKYSPEVARQIIQEQMKTGGNALPWGNTTFYTELMLQRSVQCFLEHTPAS